MTLSDVHCGRMTSLLNPASPPPRFPFRGVRSPSWVEDFPRSILLPSPLIFRSFGPNKPLHLQFHFSIYFPEAPVDLYSIALHSQSQMWISGSKMVHWRRKLTTISTLYQYVHVLWFKVMPWTYGMIRAPTANIEYMSLCTRIHDLGWGFYIKEAQTEKCSS